jgi:hypothetical protein
MPVLWVADYQLTQGSRTIGWSEEFVLNAANITAANEIIDAPQGILQSRCQIFGAGVTNTENRLTLLPAAAPFPIGPQRRASQLSGGLPPQGATAEGTLLKLPYYNAAFSNLAADFGQATYLIRAFSDPGTAPSYVRSIWLSGCPDASQNTTSAVQTNLNVQASIQQFMVRVRSFVLIQSVDRSDVYPYKPVTGYNPTTNIYTIVGHGFTQGMPIEALGWRGNPGAVIPRGRYKVLYQTVDTFSLQGAAPLSGTYVIGGFRKLAWVYTPVFSYTYRSFTNRKRGRPFDQLAGRRRALTRSRA